MKHQLRAFFLCSLCLALICVPALLGSVWATGQGPDTVPPTVVQLDSLEDQYEAVTFNHEMHTYIAEGCGKCHHSHSTELARSCHSCHDLDTVVFKQSVTTAFMACRNCHGTYSSASPSMPGLKVAYHKRCFGCHVGIGELGDSPRACAETCHVRAGDAPVSTE